MAAIVTGAAQGIGKSIAIRLAKSGYDVCVNDISANQAALDEVVKVVKSMGRNSVGVIADVSIRCEVEHLVQKAVCELGPLRTMVANAGIAQVKAAIHLTEEEVGRMFRINVFGVHNCYSIAAKQMLKQGPPSEGVYKLIAAASIVGFKSSPMMSHYSASKWAVRGLNQAFAMELAEHKITANAYAPGMVGTPMWGYLDEKFGEGTGAKKGDMLEKYSRELIALKRASTPEDVAALVNFLASQDSNYVTGQTLLVDGGMIFT